VQRNAKPIAIGADAKLDWFGGGEDALGFTRGIGCTGGKQHEPRGHHAVGFGGEPKNGSSQLAQKSMAISRHRIATWHEASQHERRSVAQIV